MTHTNLGNGVIVFHNAFTNPQVYIDIFENDNCHTKNGEEYLSLPVDRTEIMGCDLDTVSADFEPIFNNIIDQYKELENISEARLSNKFGMHKIADGFGLDPHTDTWDNQDMVINAIAYLNDNYDGGDITFQEYELSYKPVATDIVVFCSQTEHSVNGVSNGDRYTIGCNVFDVIKS